MNNTYQYTSSVIFHEMYREVVVTGHYLYGGFDVFNIQFGSRSEHILVLIDGFGMVEKDGDYDDNTRRFHVDDESEVKPVTSMGDHFNLCTEGERVATSTQVTDGANDTRFSDLRASILAV